MTSHSLVGRYRTATCCANADVPCSVWLGKGIVVPVIGDILKFALGIAISPIPIIAAILMLLSPKAKGTSVGFLIGWLVGIVVTLIVFILLSSTLPQSDSGGSDPLGGTINIILGLGLLALSVRQWRGRPKPGETGTMPKWLGAIDTMTAGRSFVLGFLLSGVNPKNLLMAAGAGVIIGTSKLTPVEMISVGAIFVLLAASTVLVPVVAFLIASRAMRGPLVVLRGWLVQNNSTVMAVLLLVMGVVLVGKGIASF